jgi:hypothetical protein
MSEGKQRYEKLDAASRKMFELLTQAFSIVTALAWSDAVKSLFADNGVFHVAMRFGPWVYAIVLTLVVFFITQMTFFSKYAKAPCINTCSTPPEQRQPQSYPTAVTPSTAGMFQYLGS